MTDAPLTVAVLVGSTRAGRFCPTVAEWIAGQARTRADMKVDVIDLADAALPEILAADDAVDVPDSVRELSPWLAGADAFVVVTPEYNHSYPAALKNAIDWFFDEWQAKPVGYVSYGGLAGGMRAVEHLRQVFTELHAVAVRTSVAFPNYDDTFGADGLPVPAERFERTANAMLDELSWWGDALRNQRAAVPYPAEAEE